MSLFLCRCQFEVEVTPPQSRSVSPSFPGKLAESNFRPFLPTARLFLGLFCASVSLSGRPWWYYKCHSPLWWVGCYLSGCPDQTGPPGTARAGWAGHKSNQRCPVLPALCPILHSWRASASWKAFSLSNLHIFLGQMLRPRCLDSLI